MAGGINAAIVPCLKCAGPAHRIAEGQEDDYYRCGGCGSEFGIDWFYDGPPQSPCWPITEEEIQERRRLAAGVSGNLLKPESAPAGHYSDENGRMLLNLGIQLSRTEDYGQALEHFGMAADCFAETGNRLMLGVCKMNVAAMHRKQGDDAMAFLRYEQAERVFREIGDSRMVEEAQKQMRGLRVQ